MKDWVVGLHLVVSCVGAVAGPPPVVGIIGELVNLPCIYLLRNNTTAPDLRVMWQRDGNQLVHAQYGEDEWNNHQDARFKGRTRVSAVKLAQGDLSLLLGAVVAGDESVYKCIVFKLTATGPQKQQTTQVSLITAAHYSVPVISEEGDIRPGGEVNLTCRSAGGYPVPTVDWTDGEGRSLLRNRTAVISLVSDPATGLRNVTSVLQVRVSRNSSFTCSVHNNRTRETVTSVIWKCVSKACSELPRDKTTVPIVVGTLVAVALALAVGLILHRRCKKIQQQYSVTNGHDNGLQPHSKVCVQEGEMNCLNEDSL